jgi:hypothetical protein
VATALRPSLPITGLHPPIHRHVINIDASFGQEFLDVTVGQP